MGGLSLGLAQKYQKVTGPGQRQRLRGATTLQWGHEDAVLEARHLLALFGANATAARLPRCERCAFFEFGEAWWSLQPRPLSLSSL
jgi:hypothetical protein